VILAVAALLSAAIAGCKKEKAGGAGSGAAAPASAELRALLAYVPLKSDGVVGVDLAALRGSELYRSYQQRIEAAASRSLAEVQRLCGFDPITRINQVVAGGTGGPTGDATVVVRGLGRQETMSCLARAAAEPPAGVRLVIDGDYARIDEADPDADPDAPAALAGGGESLSLLFVDDTTVLLARRGGQAVDADGMRAIAAQRAGDASNVTGSAGFMEMIDAVDTQAPLWFVISGKADQVRRMGRGLLSFDAAFGDVRVGRGLDIRATLRLDSEDAAARLAQVAQRQVDSMKKSLMKDMLGPIQVQQTGRDIRFQVQQSREQLEKLADFASSFAAMGLFGN
jgi:hypothetical protein